MKLIIGKLNNDKIGRYWKMEQNLYFNVGDYAIVENLNGYDLVKVIGLVETDEENVKKIIGLDINKKVIRKIPNYEVEE